ncbi:hypothetical protein ACFVGM_09220 [Kitasatospora purpeofusca]|uniref:hypothetical protein n=1 Tax=Kitasatospora purpeofusca TaxID=67352 RepID=UPI0036B8106A
MEIYNVAVSRTEGILYSLPATSADDAEDRYLADGDEIASKTLKTVVEKVTLASGAKDPEHVEERRSTDTAATPEPPQFHWAPESMGDIDSGFSVFVPGRFRLGYVYETVDGRWTATHAENYDKLTVAGFASMEAAFDFLYYVAPPAAREV